MLKKLFLVTVFTVAILASSQPAMAQSGAPVCNDPPCVYVDIGRTSGNEDGSANNPYNTAKEGEAYAQAQLDGAYLYVKNTDGTWSQRFISPVNSGPGGVPFSALALYGLLALLALGLIVVGLKFRQRSHQLQGNILGR
jgi:hypothetical protein